MRSAQPEVRNPLLQLPAAADLERLPIEAKEALRALCKDAARAWDEHAEHCWTRRKAPMAAYWRKNAVWARHLSRLLTKSINGGPR